MKDTIIKANKRELKGSKLNKLRKEKKIPGCISTLKKETLNIQLEYNEFLKTFRKAKETHIVIIDLDEEKYSILFKETHRHPVKDLYLHFNAVEVDLKKKVKVEVPIVFINEDIIPEIKSQKAILNVSIKEIELECFPNEIPEKVEIDLEKTSIKKVGDSMELKELTAFVKEGQLEFSEEESTTIIASTVYASIEEDEAGPTSIEDVAVENETKETEGKGDKK